MRKDNHVHVAFVGNPNCGKTTLFNAITGSKLKVANWPGVTVEKYEGNLQYEGYDLKLVDTPGIYYLTAAGAGKACDTGFKYDGYCEGTGDGD